MSGNRILEISGSVMLRTHLTGHWLPSIAPWLPAIFGGSPGARAASRSHGLEDRGQLAEATQGEAPVLLQLGAQATWLHDANCEAL